MSRRASRLPGHGPAVAAVFALALTATVGAARQGDGVMAGIGGVHRTGAWTPLVVPRAAGGAEAIRAWERQQGRTATPIAALTADAYEEDRRHAQAAGMDDFLTKPIEIDTLHALLARWLHPARPDAAA